MSLEYVQNYYRVPAVPGRRVTIGGAHGVIIKGSGPYISVLMDGKKHEANYHPTDGVTYGGMGALPKLTRSQLRYRRYKAVAECYDSFLDFLRYEKVERDASACGFSSVSDYTRWLATL